jgi:hypothetical protein
MLVRVRLFDAFPELKTDAIDPIVIAKVFHGDEPGMVAGAPMAAEYAPSRRQ